MVVISTGFSNTGSNGDKSADVVDGRFVVHLKDNKEKLVEELKKYDQKKNGTVTKTELRNALEAIAGEPISSRLFDKLIEGAGFAVDYAKCLDKIGLPLQPPSRESNPSSEKSAAEQPNTLRLTRSMTMLPGAGDTESAFRQKLQENVIKVLKGLRLFDFNRDGRIQKHELKKTFDTHVMKLTDQQFDRIWSRYEVNHNSGTTTTNYHDFLRRLGITDEQLASVGSGAKSEKPQSAQPVLTDSVMAAYTEHPPSAGKKDTLKSALRPLSSFKHVVRNEDIATDGSHLLSESNIDFLENQLRAGMTANRVSVVKMFSIFDKDASGYITLDDLHKTVNNFVVQCTYPVFQQLMERIGLKASHTIAYREFMRKFEPITIGGQENGSFLPIRGNHRSFPVKGSDQPLSINTLLTKLHDHIRNDYPSLKEAFLLINETHDGVVTPAKLQKVLSARVQIPVTDSQMTQLWALLQPAGSPPLDYQRFVSLFEMTDTADGHPWLQSCHRVNDFRHPPPLTGPQAVELVQQHATNHWSEIAADLAAADRNRKSTVSVSKLKQILVTYVGPIDDATFSKWIRDCSSFKSNNQDTNATSGEVNYREFFSKLGVESNPSDKTGLSTRILDENINNVDRLLEDQHFRQQMEAMKAADRANAMSVDEVVVRLRDRFEQRSGNFFKTFVYFAKKRKQSYRLSRGGFRKMLAHIGFLLTDEHFSELCSRLSFTGHYMTYDDFVRSFEQLFFQAPSDVERKDNHRFNEIRGGERLLGASDAYDMLKKKLLQNFDSLKKAFDYADVGRSGFVNDKGVLRLIDSLNIPMDPNCIGEIMQRLSGELKKTSPLEYISLEQFRDIFEFREDERGHKWKSDHRFNKQIQGEFPTTPQGVLQMLMLKLRTTFNSPTEAFLLADSRKTGRITKRDLGKLFEKVHMSVSEPLVSGVWQLLDPVREGSINMEAFFQRSGVDNPGDAHGGFSEQIIASNVNNLEELVSKMKERHQQATDRQVAMGKSLTAEVALGTLAQKLVDTGLSLDTLFAKYDVKKRGFLSAQQIQNILHNYHLFLTPSEEERFFTKLGIGINGRSTITLEVFKAAFCDQNLVVGNEVSVTANKPKAENELRFPPPASLEKLSYAANADIWRRARQVFTKHADLMQKAFSALDKSSSGRLAMAEFERVLSAFCGPRIPLAFVRSRYPPAYDGTIDYRSFLSGVSLQNVPAIAASALLGLNSASMEQIATMRRLAQAIRSRHYNLVAACEELDHARYGVLSPSDFRSVLQQFTFTITDQFYNYLSTLPDLLPANEKGEVFYREALSTLSTAEQSLPAPSGEALPPIINEDRPNSPRDTLPPIDDAVSVGGRSYGSGRSSTIASSVITELLGGDLNDFGFGGLPMVDATKAETQVYPAMVKRWRRFHRACRAADNAQTGFLPTPAVDRIFQEIGITLPDGDFQVICRKYDMKNSGSFAYRHFIRQMILTSSKERTKATSSEVANPALSVPPMVRALLSTAERWRDLRRWFRGQPQTSPGVVSLGQLRHGLRTVADANITEEQFAELTNRLDPKTTGYIRYDDLFRLALRCASNPNAV